MGDRTAAILVDAGYVWKQVAKAVGKQHRREVPLVGYGVPLIEALVEEAEGDDLRVLRTYWYDGAPDRIPNVQQRAVGRATRVKLRIGSMSANRQKGVDRLLQRDILALSQNKAVTDLVILTGDQDMEEELDSAGQHGLVVHLWGIADQDQNDQISSRLLRIVDDWKVLPAHWAATFVPEPTSEDTAASHEVPLTSDSQVHEFRSTLRTHQPTRSKPSAAADSARPEWGPDQLVEAGRAACRALAEQYGPAWAAIRVEIRDTKFRTRGGEFRSIPGRYDTELMDTADAILGTHVRDSADRVLVRDGFWDAIDEVAASTDS